MATISHLFDRLTVSASILALCAGISISAEPEPKAKERGAPNRLAKESSPYLLQHSHNPVDWYPWGSEAFEKAKKEKKLVFLSIGYSSCHWCHVMEKESFSNKEVADIMNANFVCIKVDREERPDVDEIYMASLSVVGGRGGWPLSMFLTADGKPIIGGTYWPREDREIDGKKANGFKTILKMVSDAHKEKPKELEQQASLIAEETSEQLSRTSRIASIVELDRALANGAAEALREEIDPVYGGIGSKDRKFQGPKFPMPMPLTLLLDHARREKDKELMGQIALTLDQMARGGIYDHLGGGFHRYSTERTWTVPHFEKMLYDNAQLVELYSRAYEIDPKPEYRRVIQETLAFVDRELTSPQGGFYSALDADSNGTEGEFYVWTPGEIEKILQDKKDITIFRAAYGVAGEPNFEGKFFILKLPRSLKEVAKDQQLSEDELDKKLAVLKKKLFDVRAKRERPFLDTKILTAWNGEMIGGYALAGKVLKESAYIKKAVVAAEFLLKNLKTADGRLLRSYSTKADGKPEAKLNAYLDDYAFFVHGLLNLADATGEKRWQDEAKALTDQMMKWHGESDKGGFFFTSSDNEKLFARPKDSFDGAQPSANGMAIRNLVQLSVLFKDDSYRKKAEQSIRQFAALIRANPSSVPGMCYDLHLYLDAYAVKATEKEPKKSTPAANPLKSEEVVKVEVKAEKSGDDKLALTIKLAITDTWHIYANDPDNKNPSFTQTVITIRSKGKEVPAEFVYPKGKFIEDKIVGDYKVYEGDIVVKATLKRGKGDDGPLEVSVKVQACMGYDANGKCLQPGTIKTPVK